MLWNRASILGKADDYWRQKYVQCRLYTTIHSTSERKDEYPFFEKIMPVLNEGLKTMDDCKKFCEIYAVWFKEWISAIISVAKQVRYLKGGIAETRN